MRLAKVLAPGAARLLSRKMLPAQLKVATAFVPAGELLRQVVGRITRSEVLTHHVWLWTEPFFDRQVARRFAGRSPILYGHEHASLESFRVQKRAGGRCVLRQVMAHYETADRLYDEELERFPAADSASERAMRRTRKQVNDRKAGEYDLADLIVTNSEFVRQSFINAGLPASKVVAVPTGCPAVAFTARRPPSGTVRFLCVGHLSLRKGTPYLIEAWRRLGVSPQTAELILAGAVSLPESLLRDLPPGLRIVGHLGGAQLAAWYRAASVFVLPTLCEGSAHSVLEAIAHGLPVITTPNSGSDEFVKHGTNGYIVPIRDPDTLADRMAWCIDHPECLGAMGEASWEIARQSGSERSERVHVAVLRSFLNSGSPSPPEEAASHTANTAVEATPDR